MVNTLVKSCSLQNNRLLIENAHIKVGFLADGLGTDLKDSCYFHERRLLANRHTGSDIAHCRETQLIADKHSGSQGKTANYSKLNAGQEIMFPLRYTGMKTLTALADTQSARLDVDQVGNVNGISLPIQCVCGARDTKETKHP